MITLDNSKFRGIKYCNAILRPNWGKGEPIEVTFITNIFVDDNNYITALNYMDEFCRLRGANGNQIDQIIYL